MDGASVVIDDVLKLLIHLSLAGDAECKARYEVTCCLQMGQFLCYRRELVRQEEQKVCPHEMVMGLR